MIAVLIVISLLLVLFTLRFNSAQPRLDRITGNSFYKIAFIVLFISLPLIGYGTHLQATSPNYKSYLQHQIDISVAENPGNDLGPGFGLGLVMASAWPFTVLVQSILILIFAACILIIGTIIRRTRTKPISRVVFIVFIGVLSFGTFMLLSDVVENIRWGYILLAIAQIITSLALIIGSVGLFREISNENAREGR